MITLHGVTKEVGHGARRRVVFDNVSCVIPRRCHLTILGLRGSGKTTLLRLLSGALVPTDGWVERRCSVSAAGSSFLVKHGTGLTTPRQLARRLATAYQTDPKALADFVDQFAALGRMMDLPVATLTRMARQKLGLALFYGIRCDFYLFDSAIGSRLPDVQAFVREAFAERRQEAGMILATSNLRAARDFGGNGAVIRAGRLVLFETLEEAIEEYEALLAAQPTPPIASPIMVSADEDAEEQ